jgi:polysaccharide deacetylase 2 family uncharacterized protein YibQ
MGRRGGYGLRLGPAVIGPGGGGSPPAAEPVVGIIIDDLGDRLDTGAEAVSLPGPVTCSFLPHTPYAKRLAIRAHRRGKEVMLHLPMEAVTGNRLGPGGLTLDMTHKAFVRTVRADLTSIPYARGINNHMGSLLTRHPGDMAWLMEEIATLGGLYFVDSRTTVETVALQVAHENRVPSASRDVFLDDDRDPRAIRRQLARLLTIARTTGKGVAIGHPYPETLRVLKQIIPHLHEYGVRLVPMSVLITPQDDRRSKLWQASLSPSPLAAKSSKPSQ